MLLGCIADDLTGATDLALTLQRGGMRTLQVIGVPREPQVLDGFDAIVVALKSRTNAPDEAVAWSLAAAEALLGAGARQLFFKYCSTFDSTDRGNIGPVADALLARTGAEIALATPAFPTNKRTVYQGHLFVGGVPLSESPMKDHPLTPMRDSSLVRVLQRQSGSPVGLIPYGTVDQGRAAIAAAVSEAAASGTRLAIIDALSDRHLHEIGAAAAGHRLITGGSGMALGLPANFAASGLLRPRPAPASMTAPPGRALIVAGSCSEATRGQIAAAKAAGVPSLKIDPAAVASGTMTAADAAAWARRQPSTRPVLIYASDTPDAVRAAQAALGADRAGAVIEDILAESAARLVGDGFTRLIVAGGETSGAVVGRLGVAAVEIGPEIDPGVPWTRAVGDPGLALALKSGNFGAPDFFLKAWTRLA